MHEGLERVLHIAGQFLGFVGHDFGAIAYSVRDVLGKILAGDLLAERIDAPNHTDRNGTDDRARIYFAYRFGRRRP